MNQVIWGALSAGSFGTADFMAGISGRSVGFARALFWVFVISSGCLGAYLFIGDHSMQIDLVAQWRVVLFGLMNTCAMLLLYRALSLGPISLAAPIVAAHPALVVLFAFLIGSRPEPAQWLGMALAVAGAIVVARAATSGTDTGSRSGHRTTIIVSVLACLAYTVMIVSG